MKKLKISLIFFVLMLGIPVSSESFKQYHCPDDDCNLIYAGRDRFCVGINCRHTAIYECKCCGKEWEIYVD